MSVFDVILFDSPEAAGRRVLHLQGDAFEQGRQHGHAVADLMRRNLDVINGQLAARRGQGLDAAYREAARFVETGQPEFWREFQGMAEGSGMPFEDILTLNLKLASVLGWLDIECSQFARVVRDAAGKTRTFICKTRDQKGGPVEHVVLTRRYPDGLEMLEVQKAGIITYPGSIMTSQGFALGTSGVWSKRTPFDRTRLATADIGPSSHDVARKATSLDDLLALVATQPRLTGINNLVATSGDVAALEVTADAANLLDRGEMVVRTNHYLTPAFADLSPRPEEASSTFSRFARISALLPEATEPEDFWRIAQDHVGHPQDSVCRHKEVGAPGSFTTYASVFVLEERKAYIGFGNPCSIRFRHSSS